MSNMKDAAECIRALREDLEEERNLVTNLRVTESEVLELREKVAALEEAVSPVDYRSEVMRNCPAFTEATITEKLSLGGLGVAGESGEVADIIKKVLYHGVALDATMRTKLIKEMGDVHWYLEYLAAVLGVTTAEVIQANVDKLRARYPNGFNLRDQLAKADERAS